MQLYMKFLPSLVLLSKVWNAPTSKDFHYLFAKQAMERTKGDQLKSNKKYWRLREKRE